MKGVAAVIVLYHPANEVAFNVRACLAQVDHLYLIDNTEPPSPVANSLTDARISLVSNGRNMGLAYALNQGADRALANGYRWLLTLDQDSCVEPGMVDALLAAYGPGLEDACMLAPGELVGSDLPSTVARKVSKVISVWTSGSLLSLTAYQAVGPFRNDLFIDFIDHEYCLRANSKGWAIYRVPGARLRHRLGEKARRFVLMGRSVWITNHAPLRRYYIMRNRLLVKSWYATSFPQFFRKDRMCMLMEMLTVLFCEKQKMQKFRMMLRGVRDYRRGVLGEYRG